MCSRAHQGLQLHFKTRSLSLLQKESTRTQHLLSATPASSCSSISAFSRDLIQQDEALQFTWRSRCFALLCSKKDRAAGCDTIPVEMWQVAGSRGLLTWLLTLCRQVVCREVSPSEWTKAFADLLIPVLRPGTDATLIASYRPMSLLPTSLKIFERLLAEQLH